MISLRNKPIRRRRPGTTPMGRRQLLVIANDVTRAAFAKGRKKGLEAEVAMNSRKTSIGKHREANMGLNGGDFRERDHSVT